MARSAFLWWVVAFAAVTLAGPGAADELTGTCVGVVDGDTLQVDVDGEQWLVRIEGIEAPEIGQPFGEQARAFTADLVRSQEIAVTTVRTEPGGVVVARVRVADADVSEAVLGAGLAWHDTDNNDDEQLVLAMIMARSRGAGLWSEPEPEHPKLWRDRHRAPAPTPTPTSTLADLAESIELQKNAGDRTVIAGLPPKSARDGEGDGHRGASATVNDDSIDFKFTCPEQAFKECARREFDQGFAKARPGQVSPLVQPQTLDYGGGSRTVLFKGVDSKGQSINAGVNCTCGDSGQCDCSMRIATAREE